MSLSHRNNGAKFLEIPVKRDQGKILWKFREGGIVKLKKKKKNDILNIVGYIFFFLEKPSVS